MDLLSFLKAAGFFVLATIAAELIGLATANPMRRLLSPPHGAYFLALSWSLALAAALLGWQVAAEESSLGIILFISAPMVALLPTLIYRDQKRSAAGLAPVRTIVPNHLGTGGRIGAFGLLLVFVLIAGLELMANRFVWAVAFAICGFMALWAAVTGRVPIMVRRIFGGERPTPNGMR